MGGMWISEQVLRCATLETMPYINAGSTIQQLPLSAQSHWNEAAPKKAKWAAITPTNGHPPSAAA